MNTVPIPKRLSVLFCDVLVTGSAELKEKQTAGGGYKVLTIEENPGLAFETWVLLASGPWPEHPLKVVRAIFIFRGKGI
jgi:hypothetical protein